jgi:hypothetical protein
MSLPPKVTRIKRGGISTICLRPFVRGKINPEKFVSLENILHLVDEDMVWNVERYSVSGMGYLKQSSEGQRPRVEKIE